MLLRSAAVFLLPFCHKGGVTGAVQVTELQAAVGAEAQRRQETEKQLARNAQEAAEAAADKQALTEDLATHKAKVQCLLDGNWESTIFVMLERNTVQLQFLSPGVRQGL